ncbi:DUF1738 domain-containing protein [bacterium]|nr:DUF1738 domain-containing protein [bacterium]
MNNRIVSIVTDRIIQKLEQGVVPWRQTWNAIPCNLVTRKPYRGLNVFILAWSGYESPLWATFKQISSIGGQVKRGEKGTPIIYWNWIERIEEADEQAEGRERRIPFLRYYSVFNVSQCVLPEGTEIPAVEKIMDCEQIYANMPDKPVIKHEGLSACYNPGTDEVYIPGIQSFANAPSFYQAIYHELTHATGHPRRLNR